MNHILQDFTTSIYKVNTFKINTSISFHRVFILILFTFFVFLTQTQKSISMNNYQDKTIQHKVYSMDELAIEYVKLALEIGEKDKDFVDAYYGPAEYKPAKSDVDIYMKKDYLDKISKLKDKIRETSMLSSDSYTAKRGQWLIEQLIAFERRVRVFSGEIADFDIESKELFGVVAPHYTKEYFETLLNELNSIVPGKGDLNQRIKDVSDKFIIPEDKLDVVFKAAIDEARKRTKKYYNLPNNEVFSLEYVKGTSWSGYNWYKGNYNSLIQINTDLPIYIDRAIDLACHEGYPGHHIYNLLLEKNLYHDQNRIEISMYPLFSPQSLIAEGTANYGIEMAFPGAEKVKFTREVLLPLAGIDTTGIDLYFKINEIKGKLNFARNEVGRGVLNKTMSHDESINWLKTYNLMTDEAAHKSIRFINNYRTYIINYNYGLELVSKYIEHKVGNDKSEEKRWEVFGELLSNQVRIEELFIK